MMPTFRGCNAFADGKVIHLISATQNTAAALLLTLRWMLAMFSHILPEFVANRIVVLVLRQVTNCI